MLYILCRSIDEVMLKCQHDHMRFMHLTYFDHQFLFISGSLKNDVHTHVSHKVANIYYTTMTRNIIDLYD